MKYPHIIVVLLALAFAGPVALAQTGTAATGGNADSELKKIEQEMLDALLKGDVSAGKKYLAETYSFTAPNGELQNKAQFIADVTSGDLKITSATYADMKVQSYGNTAVVTYRSTDKGTYKGRDISGDYRWTDVFVNTNGQWQQVVGHGCEISAKK